MSIPPVNLMRSFLFVPGNRPERFAKARASGADIYCIDLEDAVAPAHKASARDEALAHLTANAGQEAGGPLCYFRINSLSTRAGLEDLLALSEAASHDVLPDCIVLPKASSAFEIAQVIQLLEQHPRLKVMPMIESPKGLDQLPAMLEYHRWIVGVAFGFGDYAAVTGSDMGWDALLQARSTIVRYASDYGVHSFDGPWFEIPDLEGLRREAGRVAGLGFRGKLAIHPSQVEVINESFQPSPRRIAWARDVIAAFAKAQGGVAVVDGMMIDQPVVEQACRVLAAAGEATS